MLSDQVRKESSNNANTYFKKKTKINKTSFQSMISDSSIYFSFNLQFARVHVEWNFSEKEPEIT